MLFCLVELMLGQLARMLWADSFECGLLATFLNVNSGWKILLSVAWSAHCSGAVMWVLGTTCPLWGLCSPFYHLHLGLLTLRSCLGNTLLPLPPFIASRMTVSYLERKGGQGHFQELLMEK